MSGSLILIGRSNSLPKRILEQAVQPTTLLDLREDAPSNTRDGRAILADYADCFDGDVLEKMGYKCLETVTSFIAELSLNDVFIYRDISIPGCLETLFIFRYVWPMGLRYYWLLNILRKSQPVEMWVNTFPREASSLFAPGGQLITWLGCDNGWEQMAVRAATSLNIPVKYFGASWRPRVCSLLVDHLGPSLLAGYRNFRLALDRRNIPAAIKPSGQRPLVMTFVRSPTHQARIHPVMSILQERGNQVIELYEQALGTYSKVLISGKYPAMHLGSWCRLRPRFRLNVRAVRSHLHRYMRADIVPDQDQWTSGGWIFQQLSRLTYLYREVATYIDAFYDLLQAWKPDVVILGYDQDPPGKALARVCRRLKIPTLTVQHGFNDAPPIGLMPVECDKIAVMGQRIKDILIRYGTPPGVVEVTGVPGLDGVSSKFNEVDSLENNGAVTFITGPMGAQIFQLSDLFLRAAASLPDVSFIIKVHPQESPTAYLKQAQGLSNVRVIIDSPIPQVLAQSSLVVGVDSTVLLQAMQRGLPVIVFNRYISLLRNPYYDGAYVLQPDEDLSTAINHLRLDRQSRVALVQKQFALLDYMSVHDGLAAKRIADMAEDLIAQSGDRN